MYKVVKRQGNKLTSAIVSGQAETEYIPGEWAQAPDWLAKDAYGLTVFLALHEAISFSRSMSWLEIWECEVENLYLPLVPIYSTSFLARGRRIRPYAPVARWPPGTMMAERIKLTRRMEDAILQIL